MKADELKTLIDKVVGKRGPLRAPAWWVRKIFRGLVESDETLADSISKNSSGLANEIAARKSDTASPFIIEWTGASVSCTLDGVRKTFDAKCRRAWAYFRESFRVSGNEDSVTSIDLSRADTRWMTNMGRMFTYCFSLQSLDLSGFDTSKVTNMESMFYDCESLQSLDLSGFDTSKVTNMESMFYGCYFLQSLDLSGFDTSKVTNMKSMFFSCSNLAALTLSAAFFNSASLTTYDFSALTAWTDADSLATLVEALPTITTAKTIKLSANTKAALTDGQKETITATKGWTIA